jgi:hypothetical protein
VGGRGGHENSGEQGGTCELGAFVMWQRIKAVCMVTCGEELKGLVD